MRICEQCGVANADNADFCGGCGEFLEWTGESQPPPGTPPAAPPVTPPVSPPPVAPPVSPPRVSAPPVVPPVSALPAAPSVSSPAFGSAPVTPRFATAEPEPSYGAGEPRPVQPAERVAPRRRPPVVVADTPRLAPGEVPCVTCGTGNNPQQRRFCSRCGTLLTAPTVVRLPWWRRLLARLRGKGLPAGYRPRARRRRSSALWALLAFILAAVLAVAMLPQLRGYAAVTVTAVKDRFAQRTQLTPTKATASSAAPKQGPQLVFDGVTNTYWAPAKPPSDAAGEWIEVELPEPVRLLDLVFFTGISDKRDAFLTQARPDDVEITLTSADGRVQTRNAGLRDETGQQRVKLVAEGVVRIRVTVMSTYGSQPGRQLAIGELEVWVRG